MPFDSITVVPAYGRDYKSKAEALAAWSTGVDWKIPDGPYVSARDIPHAKLDGVKEIRLRYKKQREVYIIKL
jgi:hypothetical protein